MLFWIVMFTVGSLRSFAPSGGLYMWRYMLMFSSSPQLAETWSIMMLPMGLPPIESLRSRTSVSPRRNRMCRTTTSWVSSSTVLPAMHTPSPGAELPSIVM